MAGFSYMSSKGEIRFCPFLYGVVTFESPGRITLRTDNCSIQIDSELTQPKLFKFFNHQFGVEFDQGLKRIRGQLFKGTGYLSPMSNSLVLILCDE